MRNTDGITKRKLLLVSANRFAVPYPVYPIGLSYICSYLTQGVIRTGPSPGPPLRGFTPVAWLPGKHLETIVPAFWPAQPPRGREITRVVRVAHGSSVLVRVAWPVCAPRGTLLLVHGMG